MTVTDCRQYKSWWTGCRRPCQFLTRASTCKRPLAKTLVFERMASARNSEHQRLLSRCAGRDDEEPAPVADDMLAALDLGDGIGAVGPVAPTSSRRIKKRCQVELSKATKISMDRVNGPPWQPFVLMEPATKVVAMEASAEHFQALLEFVQAGLLAGKPVRVRHGAKEAPRARPIDNVGARARTSLMVSARSG